MWQELYAELRPQGLEIVTVALDTAGPDAARPFVEAAHPTHPSLIDEAHVLDELLGIVNVPSGVWIDEWGVIVRPPEPAFPRRPSFLKTQLDENADERLKRLVSLVKRIRVEADEYVAALRDWVARGSASRYALTPDEVVARSQPRDADAAAAAAHFELGQHLHHSGEEAAARQHFRIAHRLQPENWTYKRQAWSLVDPRQGPTEHYDGDFMSDVEAAGPETYYPKLRL